MLPLDDRSLERLDAKIAGRPELMLGRTSLKLYPGMRVSENTMIDFKNTSYSITADLEVQQRANGVVFEQGGAHGGLSLYLKDGRPHFSYNFLGLTSYEIASTKPVPEGRVELKFDFSYDGGGRGKGGTGRIFVNGAKVAEGRIDRTQSAIIAPEETADVGLSTGTPASSAYRVPFACKGTIRSVLIELTGETPTVKK